MEKLPKKFKKDWVNALRSGKYKQGYRFLKCGIVGETYHCCLGVACEIVGDEIPTGATWIPDNAYDVPEILHEKNDITESLAGLNDAGVPFEVIAGVINEWL